MGDKDRKDQLAFAFVDTNIFLHFTYFDQIDWPRELGYRSVCLVIAPTVLAELDDFKYDRDSKRRQERSAKVTKHLSAIAEATPAGIPAPIPDRKDVQLLLLAGATDVSSYSGLVPSVKDDQIVASVLSFQERQPDPTEAAVLVVSDDVGMRTKCRSRGITAVGLDDRWQLPSEPTKEQMELRRLQNELAALKSRGPQLSLAFSVGSEYSGVVLADLSVVEPLTSEQIAVFVAAEAEAVRWSPPEKPPRHRTQQATKLPNGVDLSALVEAAEATASALSQMSLAFDNSYPKEEIDRYEEDKRKYLDDYAKYLEVLVGLETVKRRSLRLVLTLLNEGTEPAQGVVVQLHVPDGPRVWRDEDQLEVLDPPSRPKKPRTNSQIMFDSLHSSIGAGLLASLPNVSVPGLSRIAPRFDPDEAGPRIRPSNSTEVEWSRSKVVHNLPLTLTPLLVTFPSALGERSYEILYSIHAENLPTPRHGSLSIAVRMQSVQFSPPNS